MYKVPKVEIPKEYTFTEYVAILITDIKNDKDVEYSKDTLFRLTYPLMVTELRKYSNIDDPEEMLPDLSIAFMKTIKYFDPGKSKTSFINYFRRVLQSELLHRRYGKYTNYKEKREAYRNFHTNISSLDFIINDKSGIETATRIDLVVDESVHLEENLLYDETLEAVYKIIDKMFDPKGRGRGTRMINAKHMFTYYIECMITDKPVTYDTVGEKFGVGKSGVCNIVKRYLPVLKDELRQLGY